MNDFDWLKDKAFRKLKENENLLNQGFRVSIGFPIPLTDNQIDTLQSALKLEGYISVIECEKTLNGDVKFLSVQKEVVDVSNQLRDS